MPRGHRYGRSHASRVRRRTIVLITEPPRAPAEVAAGDYKEALSRFASGVTLITVAAGGEQQGMTATSFASVSLVPPLVLVCLEEGSRTRRFVEQTGGFAVNVLAEDQRSLAEHFSSRKPKSFAHVPYTSGILGAPLIAGALASLECRTEQMIDAGDHVVAIARVISVITRAGNPLAYFSRAYRHLG